MDRERAGVGVDGLPGRRDAAADGRRRSARSPTAASYVEPRVVRAVYRDDRRYHVQRRRSCAGPSAPTPPSALTAIMEERRRRDGTAKARADIPATPIAGKTGTAQKLINGHYSTCRLQRVVRRLPAVARSRRSRSSSSSIRRTARTAITAAPWRRRSSRRIAEAALRYLGVAADDQPGAAGARRRADERSAATSDRGRRRPDAPVVSLVADGPPGTVPDSRPERPRSGAQARQARAERARRRRRLRRVAGSQPRARRSTPAAVCRLVLRTIAAGVRGAGGTRHDLGRAARRAPRRTV